MKNQETAEMIKSLMDRWNKCRKLWFQKNGNYDGFEEWFTIKCGLK